MSHRAADAIRDHVRDVVVAEVEPLLLSHVYPAEDSQSWSGGTLPGITVALVRVTTTDGLHGIGETYLGNFAPDVHRALTRHFAPFVVGHDAADIDGFWTRCLSRNRYWARSGAPVTVLAAIESALLDVCGKAAAKPVHQLLGTAHEALPRYASGGMDADLTRLGVEQAGYRDAGFLGTKIRAGVDAHADVEKTLATIEAVGPDVRVAVDAVQGSNPRPWTAAQAIEVGRLLEPFDLLWFEEPCGAEDVEGHRACRDALTIPVAGGETRTTIAEFDAMISAGAVDVIQPDAAWCGIVPTVEVARRAERAGMDMAVHAWASGGCVMANYHAAFASPAATWLEYPTQPNPLVDALMVEPLTVEDGLVKAPQQPGLGIDVTDELLEAYPYRPGNHYHFEERR